eukprot:808300-Ditylum_brightwellii.AAC.1
MEGGRLKGKRRMNQCHGVERPMLCLNQWLTVIPNVANNSILVKDEFWDMVLLWYKIVPKDLPKVCDGCGKFHSLQHALQCKKGGLIGAHRNEARDDLGLTASWTYSQATSAPAVSIIKPKDKEKAPNLYGDLLIRGLWKPQTDAIIDVSITNTDTKSYISRLLKSVLAAQEREKKEKYLQHCLDQRCHFSSFVVSVDSMLGKEATIVLKQISRKLAQKWECSL